MRHIAATHTYGVVGSSALAPRQPELVVIEGAKPQVVERAHPGPERLRPLDAFLAYLAVVAVVAALAATYAFVDVSIAARLDASLHEVEATSVYVRPGDSLWALAESHPVEGRSTSEVVRWIQERNSLESSTIVPGQQLLVPASGEVGAGGGE